MLTLGEIRKLIEKVPDDAEVGFYIKIHGTVITFSDDSELRDLAASFDLKHYDHGSDPGDDPDYVGY